MPQKTAWEILKDKLSGKPNPPAGRPFYNPTGARVGQPQLIDLEGARLEGYSWTVSALVEYSREINRAAFKFSDCVLSGFNPAASGDAAKIETRLRSFPNANGGVDQVFLELEDEIEFSQDFLGVVNDDTGKFEITGDGAEPATFFRVNNARSSYSASALRVTAQTADGAAAEGGFTEGRIEYWDYWREPADGGLKEFVYIEKNEADGWFQIWRGKEYVE